MANLISQYKLNDNLATTNVIDSQGNNNGSLHGGDNTQDLSVAGKINTALHFDGSADYVKVDYDVSLFADEMTISFWAKSDKSDYSAQGWVVSMWDYSTNKRMWGISVNSTNDEWTIATSSNGTINASVSTGIAVDTLYHYFTFVVNNTTKAWKVYLDGVYQSTITADYTYVNKNSFMTIGGLAGIVFFDGIIDDLRIYNKQLGQAEIDFLYNSGNGTEDLYEEYYTGNLLITLTPTSTYKGGCVSYTGSIPIIITPESSYKGGCVFYTGNLPITITPSYSIRETLDANHCSRILWYNPLIIICDTDPAKVIKIDFSSGGIPSQTLYTLNASGETVKNAKDIVINNTFSQVYIACADGQVMKINLNDYNDRTQINTGDSNDLLCIDCIDDFKKTLVSSDSSDGEIFEIDEPVYQTINTDFRYLTQTKKIINTDFSYIQGQKINTDFRYNKISTQSINTDFRYLLNDFSQITPCGREDFVVKIDDVVVTDVDLTNISVRWTADDFSTASFSLARKHDKINYTLEDVYQQINNQNDVKIYFNNIKIFEGKIETINGVLEQINVSAKGEEWTKDFTEKDLPLPSVNEQRSLYHIIEDKTNIDIYNPYISPDEEEPMLYKGIKLDLGIQTAEVWWWAYLVRAATWEEIEEYNPKQNYTYFWQASAKKVDLSKTYGATYFPRKYLGSSLSVFNTDCWEITNILWKANRQMDDIETELGEYTLGSEPYKIINPKTGKHIAKPYWKDKADGFYDEQNKSYDYINYSKLKADVEYEKMKNINGNILPDTRATLELTIDALLYYNLVLLNRVNIVNTTETDIYKHNNGFPLAIKGVDISSRSMTVNLTLDNKLSKFELDELDDQLPTDEELELPPYVDEGFSNKILNKFDPSIFEDVV